MAGLNGSLFPRRKFGKFHRLRGSCSFLRSFRSRHCVYLRYRTDDFSLLFCTYKQQESTICSVCANCDLFASLSLSTSFPSLSASRKIINKRCVASFRSNEQLKFELSAYYLHKYTDSLCNAL